MTHHHLAFELLNSLKGQNDIVCRWGGDEFLFLMKDCNADEAEKRMTVVLNTLKKKNGYTGNGNTQPAPGSDSDFMTLPEGSEEVPF